MIRYILFDLDETLYPVTSGLMPAIGDRMRLYLQERYQLEPEVAHALQKRYWTDYGTTLRGLMMEHDIDPQDYLQYVHDVDVAEYIMPDARLGQMLAELPYEKVIMTNADAPHAERVLARLGVAAQFTRIFDIVFMEFDCKPARGAYERVLKALGAQGEECVLVEDSARNLTAAHELGMQTILLLPKDAPVGSGTWLPDPARRVELRECPPTANRCIEDIYQVAAAVQELVRAVSMPQVSRVAPQ